MTNDKKKQIVPAANLSKEKDNKSISGNRVPQGKGTAKISEKKYRQELRLLHEELVHLQSWVISKGLKVCIVFEGRDGAGKGGTIKALTERVSPRVFRIVALPAPSEREKPRKTSIEVYLHTNGAKAGLVL